MNIYTPAGWLDVPHIEQIANRNNIAFIVIIGKRQIGKTYNVLKHMLDTDKRFVLMRGVKTELDMLKRNVNSPFEKIEGYKGRIVFESETEYTASILRLDETDEGEIKTNIGMCAALSSIGRIRGFNGDIYTDVVYDEFIPESHLLKVRHGDDAFNNMYTTIAGNRELEGESRIIKDRGIMIILPDSAVITEKRKQTALYRAIGGDSKFSKMAYENAFAYNEYTDVGQKPLAEYKPIIAFPACIVHLHKSDKTLYVTTFMRCQAPHVYTDGDYGRMTFAKDFPEIRAAYMRGRITFQSMAVKNYFLDILDML